MAADGLDLPSVSPNIARFPFFLRFCATNSPTAIT
jgi:hypothetical protein